MTATLHPLHDELPRTTGVDHPRTAVLHRLRPVTSRILRARYRVEVYGAANVPATGPVVIAANHTGVIDGPAMAILSPRPVHALTKSEMFVGRTGRFLVAAGQIPVDRHNTDVIATRTALRVLRDGGVVGIFPEGARGAGDVDTVYPGAAYFALATGATVVPLAMLGTRVPGGSLNSVPPRGTRMVFSFGPPMRFDHHDWPRRRNEVAVATVEIRDGLRTTLRATQDRTGMSLPGPIPATNEKEQL